MMVNDATGSEYSNGSFWVVTVITSDEASFMVMKLSFSWLFTGIWYEVGHLVVSW